MSKDIPHLRATATSKQLIVNGEPFLVLGAELQNSSLTSAAYMRGVWGKLKDAHINTVLGCVTWEHIEPEEGKFDFAELDQIVTDARAHGLRLVLLWFGSFKNGLSTYAPSWVKTNSKRFPRAKLRKAGGELAIADVVSIFHSEAQQCDARAFSKLMAHLKHIDEGHFTVIMVQVENECGLLGDSRDGSQAAERCFNQPVPAELMDSLHERWDKLRPELRQNLTNFRQRQASNQSWAEVFGKSPQTDEIFMAYHYAKYIEGVASAGKAVYELPLYHNVWLPAGGDDADPSMPVVAGGGQRPGEYPSGGGTPNVIDIWQISAPTLEFIAPDIYVADYITMCTKYRHRNQALFIPEQRRDEYGARRIWASIGCYEAIGTSPFGIDTVDLADNSFVRHYKLLSQVSSHVLQAQREHQCFGFFFDELRPDGTDPSPAKMISFGSWNLVIERSFVFGRPSAGSGMVIHKGDDRFLLLGWGYQVSYTHRSAPFTGLLRFDELEYDSSSKKLQKLRELNGDETRSGKSTVMPSESPDYGGFPIAITIPARTAIAMVEVYALEDEQD
ncbi:glycoside hydrolase family 35 protein [Baudoinia panamericana UAMH 10762]|uniref:Glycoside hydrolase family 35 protein n=1 Tax=Baudoinia panamericana (strain UAMH 10762) TaxID=717646 RepID=M2NLW9_BAUPA|nr:glycoside hydrolase family 35 protein [Baudoinia panamericana UAMH 10762]EMD00161.1 glycoside hydrolase family 35 protein [Baudoinia panamericana UAMH 10762]